MAEKVSVKGDDIHPLYKWLVDQSKEMAKSVPSDNSKDLVWKRFLQDPVTWNFTKFLLDEKGKLVAVFHNKVSPMSEEVLKYLINRNKIIKKTIQKFLNRFLFTESLLSPSNAIFRHHRSIIRKTTTGRTGTT